MPARSDPRHVGDDERFTANPQSPFHDNNATRGGYQHADEHEMSPYDSRGQHYNESPLAIPMGPGPGGHLTPSDRLAPQPTVSMFRVTKQGSRSRA